MSARDDPTDPLYWPTAPTLAVVGPNVGPFGPSQVWIVHGLPPQPWPRLANGDPPVDLGPVGTMYEFSTIELGIRYQIEAAINPEDTVRGSQVYNAPILSDAFYAYLYQTEERITRMTLDLWHVSVVAKCGGTEQSINVLNFVDGPGAGHTVDADGALMVATQVAAKWHDMVAGVGIVAGDIALHSIIPTVVTWTEVRAARIRVTAATSRDPVAGALKPDGAPERHKIFVTPKPEYLVPTQYASFANPVDVTGTGTDSLPFEVAMCLSLGTGLRGGRNRGRTYIGPLSHEVMAGGAPGMFNLANSLGAASAFKHKIVDGLAGDALPLQLVAASMRYATSRPVTEVRVGSVPDSQRRRRRSQLENYQTVA